MPRGTPLIRELAEDYNLLNKEFADGLHSLEIKFRD